jgi:plasmid stabilization system protein ParE
MRLIIDERAWRDLDDIAAWIRRDNPGAGPREVEKIRHVIGLLVDFPDLARPGCEPTQRRSVWSPIPDTSLSSRDR